MCVPLCVAVRWPLGNALPPRMRCVEPAGGRGTRGEVQGWPGSGSPKAGASPTLKGSGGCGRRATARARSSVTRASWVFRAK